MIDDELQAFEGENLALIEGSDEVKLPHRVGEEAQDTKGEPLARSIDIVLNERSHLDRVTSLHSPCLACQLLVHDPRVAGIIDGRPHEMSANTLLLLDWLIEYTPRMRGLQWTIVGVSRL